VRTKFIVLVWNIVLYKEGDLTKTNLLYSLVAEEKWNSFILTSLVCFFCVYDFLHESTIFFVEFITSMAPRFPIKSMWIVGALGRRYSPPPSYPSKPIYLAN
jgi:hypothetical protein